jgi:hypothetical protein
MEKFAPIVEMWGPRGLAQDYTTKWELAWPKLPQGSTIFEWKIFHP